VGRKEKRNTERTVQGGECDAGRKIQSLMFLRSVVWAGKKSSLGGKQEGGEKGKLRSATNTKNQGKRQEKPQVSPKIVDMPLRLQGRRSRALYRTGDESGN